MLSDWDKEVIEEKVKAGIARQTKVQNLNPDMLNDHDLSNLAATLVFILLGQRAVNVLIKSIKGGML